MKILFDFKDMTGGAPRSQLAHLQSVKENGIDVLATVSSDYFELAKKLPDVKIIKVDGISFNNPLRLFSNLKNWYKIIQNENPDIIHTNRVPHFVFLAIISDLTGTPMVFSQAGGIAQASVIKIIIDKIPIVYSLENKEKFIEAGYKDREINVISNRIKINNSHNIEPSNFNASNSLKILFVSNLKSVTIDGVFNFLKLIEDQSPNIKMHFLIHFAGKDTSGENKYLKNFIKQVELTNSYISPNGTIKYLGWIENIEELIDSHDVIIGKGRSVLQAALKSKICFVISENGELTRIKKSNFSQLYFYNFSGRGLSLDKNEEFIKMLIEKNEFNKYANEAVIVKDDVENAYSITKAYSKLKTVYDYAIFKKQKRSFTRALIKCLKYYFVLFNSRYAKKKIRIA